MSQTLDLSITPIELKELNDLTSRNKAGELSLKDKKRLAVLQRLAENTYGTYKSETVASREKKDLGQTKDDYYREGGKKVFNTDEESGRNCRYEYVTETKSVEGGNNVDFARRTKMKSIIKDVEVRCEMVDRLLNKRDLTGAEEQELKELKIKKDSNRADYDEDVRYCELSKLKFVRSKEREFAQFINGCQKCLYYKDAHRTLLPGTSFREWNMDVSTSKEPADILSTCDRNKHASIAVFNQDPLDYAAKLKDPKYGQNPVVVVDCSRMGPGGSWSRGDEGLEEQVFFRTTISLSVDKEINDHFYPLRNESVLYVPKAIVFRHNRATDYKVMPDTINPNFQSIILASGAIVRQTDIKGDDVKDRADNDRPEQEIYMEKIKNCLATAAFNGHDSIIFTALGCYSYGKSFSECADAFLYAIFDPATKFYRRFKAIVFAIPPDVIPNTEKIVEEYENGVLRKKKQIFDHNMDLLETLKAKLQQITFQDVVLSDINLNTKMLPRKPLSEAFNSLKL